MRSKTSSVAIAGLSIALALSVVANIRLVFVVKELHGEVYGAMAGSYVENTSVLSHLKSGRVTKAREELAADQSDKEAILLICLVENCSPQAAEILEDAGWDPDAARGMFDDS